MGDKSDAPTVFVDSNNIVEQSWRLDSPQWRILLHQSRHGLIQLVVPEIVVLETVARYESKLSDALKVFTAAQDNLSKMVEYSHASGLPVSPGVEAETYEHELRELLNEYNVTVPPMPPIDIIDLVSRAAHRRRPFNSDGNGFRDALIWEYLIYTMTDNIRSAPHLISTDNTFYAGKGDGTLHPELVEDAHARGVAIHVTPWRHLGAYITDAFGTDEHTFVSHVAAIIETGHGHLTDWLETNLSALSEHVLSSSDIDVEVVEFRNSHLTLKSVAKSQDGPALVNMTFTTEMTVRVGRDVVFDDGSDETTASLTLSASSLLEASADDFDSLTIDTPGAYVRAQFDLDFQSLHTSSKSVPPLLRPTLMDSSLYSRLRDLKLPPQMVGDIAKATAAFRTNTPEASDFFRKLAETQLNISAINDFAKKFSESSQLNQSALNDFAKKFSELPQPNQSSISDATKRVAEIYNLTQRQRGADTEEAPDSTERGGTDDSEPNGEDPPTDSDEK